MSSKHFHKLRVKSIRKTTADCAIISLDIPEDLRELFDYKHGQYLTFEKEINGEDIRRSYSLCSSPNDNEWEIGVKQVPGGRFSTFANSELKEGDYLEVMPPNGSFFVDINPDKERNYVAFGAGSGITPLLSIIKTHLEQEPKSSFKLFYTNKTAASIILKEELESLKNRFMDRLEIFYFLTKERRNIEFLNGRMDTEKLDIIFKTICPLENIDHFFSCGPESMIFLVRDYLLEKGVEKSKIHFELFNTSGNQAPTDEKLIKKFEGKVTNITIQEGGKSLNFEMATGSQNILDLALNNNMDLPFACKGGMCATCKAKLIEGEVDMKLRYGLEDDEVENGYILTCQSIPVSEKIIVDYDI